MEGPVDIKSKPDKKKITKIPQGTDTSRALRLLANKLDNEEPVDFCFIVMDDPEQFGYHIDMHTPSSPYMMVGMLERQKLLLLDFELGFEAENEE